MILILFMLIFVYYKCCIWSNTYAQCVVIRHTCNLFSVVFQTVAHVTCNYVWRYSTCPHTGEYTCQHNKAWYVKLILIDDNSVLLVLYWIILKKNKKMHTCISTTKMYPYINTSITKLKTRKCIYQLPNSLRSHNKSSFDIKTIVKINVSRGCGRSGRAWSRSLWSLCNHSTVISSELYQRPPESNSIDI